MLTSCDATPVNKVENPYDALFKQKGSLQHEKLPFKTEARVNMDVISARWLTLYTDNLTQQNTSTKLTHEQALQQLIDLILLAQKAKQEKLNLNQDIRDTLHIQSMNLLAKTYLDKVSSAIVITESEVQQAYRTQYQEKENLEYKTRHILVKTRPEATQLMRELAQGADFATLARKHSLDPAASFGGALEWFRLDTVDPAFANAVRVLNDTETSREPVKTQHGWHIILVEGRRKAPAPSFEEIKETLYTDLKNKKIAALIKTLRDYSTISIGIKE